MQETNINNLIDLIKSKEITTEEAVNRIWVEIYTHPNFYSLDDFDEDQRSDFLIDFREQIPKLIENYDENLGTLSNFLAGCIRYGKFSWKKQFRKQKLNGNITEAYIASRTKNKQLETDIDFLMDLRDSSQEEKTERDFSADEDSECKMKIKALTILILMLKACRDIDDNLITKISKFTEIKEEKLQKLVQDMKNSTAKNDIKIEKIISRRNNAFYFRRKHRLEMKELGIKDFSYNNLKERFERQTKIWMKNNEILGKYGSSNVPTNAEIARKLGMRPRTVGFYLFTAKKTFNLSENEEDREKEDENEDSSIKN